MKLETVFEGSEDDGRGDGWGWLGHSGNSDQRPAMSMVPMFVKTQQRR